MTATPTTFSRNISSGGGAIC
ncbi:hypothetical protein [Alistipes sp. 56_sp_Nov_56_25]